MCLLSDRRVNNKMAVSLYRIIYRLIVWPILNNIAAARMVLHSPECSYALISMHRFRTNELLFGWAWKNKMRRRQHIWILNVILMKKVSLPTFWERYVRSNKKIYKVSLAYLDLQTFPGHSLHCHNFRYIFLRNVKFLRRNASCDVQAIYSANNCVGLCPSKSSHDNLLQGRLFSVSLILLYEQYLQVQGGHTTKFKKYD